MCYNQFFPDVKVHNNTYAFAWLQMLNVKGRTIYEKKKSAEMGEIVIPVD
jgi:hypothetical protein